MKTLLTQAKNEIVGLRRRNELLEAQMGIVTVFAAALGLKENGGVMAPDVLHDLNKAIAEANAMTETDVAKS